VALDWACPSSNILSAGTGVGCESKVVWDAGANLPFTFQQIDLGFFKMS